MASKVSSDFSQVIKVAFMDPGGGTTMSGESFFFAIWPFLGLLGDELAKIQQKCKRKIVLFVRLSGEGGSIMVCKAGIGQDDEDIGIDAHVLASRFRKSGRWPFKKLDGHRVFGRFYFLGEWQFSIKTVPENTISGCYGREVFIASIVRQSNDPPMCVIARAIEQSMR
jgi:hypothetical protein